MSHVILVAFDVDEEKATDAHEAVMWLLKDAVGKEKITQWWIAEDDRFDGSDNDSAVFVNKGATSAAYKVLEVFGLTGSWNVK